MRRKICVVTGTRADYGLLYWIMKELHEDENIHFQLVVTGSHLEEKYGMTKNVILKDGFTIDKEVHCELLSDRPSAIGHSMSKALDGMLDAFTELNPDVVVILGDRFEILSVAQTCLVLNIPLAHIHGGEITEGAIDDSIRHAITKIAHIHFPANSTYKKRIMQMGENPLNIFDYGAPGLDNIQKLVLLDKNQLEESLKLSLCEKVFLVTFHPVTLDESQSNAEIENLIQALELVSSEIQIIVTMPNADTFSDKIRASWENFSQRRSKTHLFVSLGQIRYLSLMKYATVIMGNSSSGIIEAPFLRKPVIDVGIRQKGRIASSNHVIRVDGNKEDISLAIQKACSDKFLESSSHVSYLYGDGNASHKIKQKLSDIDLNGILFKKFHDLKLE